MTVSFGGFFWQEAQVFPCGEQSTHKVLPQKYTEPSSSQLEASSNTSISVQLCEFESNLETNNMQKKKSSYCNYFDRWLMSLVMLICAC